MELVLNYCKTELRHWSLQELLWMGMTTLFVTACTLISGGDDLTGIVSSLTGIAYTLLAGKGKSSCYLFGAVNTILYGYIAFRSRVYGDMLLNLGYYLPMQFAGLYVWIKHRSAENGEVQKRKLTLKNEIFLLLFSLVLWYLTALLLKHFGDVSPFLDSATTVLSITAMLLGVLRCFEQWIAWTAVNGLSVLLWLRIYLNSGEALATLLMWFVFLICGLVFARRWYQEIGAEK